MKWITNALKSGKTNQKSLAEKVLLYNIDIAKAYNDKELEKLNIEFAKKALKEIKLPTKNG